MTFLTSVIVEVITKTDPMPISSNLITLILMVIFED